MRKSILQSVQHNLLVLKKLYWMKDWLGFKLNFKVHLQSSNENKKNREIKFSLNNSKIWNFNANQY